VAAGAAVLVLLVAASSWQLPWQAAPPPAPIAVPVQLESAARAATQAEHQLRVYVHPLRVSNLSLPVVNGRSGGGVYLDQAAWLLCAQHGECHLDSAK